MRPLSNSQADAILDLLEHCRHVFVCYEQAEAASGDPEAQKKGAGGKTLAQDTESAYREALKELTDLYVAATALNVESSTLDGVIVRNLPKSVSDALIKQPAA